MAGPNYGLLDNALVNKNRAVEGYGAVNALVAQNLQNQADKMALENAMAEKAASQAAGGDINALQQNLIKVNRPKEAVAVGKATAEIGKLNTEAINGRLKASAAISDVAQTPAEMAEIMKGDFNDPILGAFYRQHGMTPEKSLAMLNQASQTPEGFRQFKMSRVMGLKGMYDQLNAEQQRTQGTIPAGYRMTQQGTLEAIPGGPTTTPIAPKDLQKREAAFPQAKASVTGYESKADKFIRDIDELLENKDGLDEITGYLAGRTELSAISPSGRKALAKYNQITAKGGFQALQDIREMSKTGGALGNVSNQEGKQLVASFAAIDRRQSADDVRAALEQVKSDIEGSKARIRETFDETYAYKQGGGAATGGGNLPTGEIGDALARFRQSKQSANR